MTPNRTNAAYLRELTADTLISQQTLAEYRVEQERTLPLADGELPHLNVFADESGDGVYQGGPTFRVTGKLQIKATVQRARFEDCRNDLDTLIFQVKDALFGEPAWIKTANQMLNFAVTASYKSNDNQHYAEALITISCQWLEIITLRGPGPLLSETFGAAIGGNTIQASVTLAS